MSHLINRFPLPYFLNLVNSIYNDLHEKNLAANHLIIKEYRQTMNISIGTVQNIKLNQVIA